MSNSQTSRMNAPPPVVEVTQTGEKVLSLANAFGATARTALRRTLDDVSDRPDAFFAELGIEDADSRARIGWRAEGPASGGRRAYRLSLPGRLLPSHLAAAAAQSVEFRLEIGPAVVLMSHEVRGHEREDRVDAFLNRIEREMQELDAFALNPLPAVTFGREIAGPVEARLRAGHRIKGRERARVQVGERFEVKTLLTVRGVG